MRETRFVVAVASKWSRPRRVARRRLRTSKPISADPAGRRWGRAMAFEFRSLTDRREFPNEESDAEPEGAVELDRQPPSAPTEWQPPRARGWDLT